MKRDFKCFESDDRAKPNSIGFGCRVKPNILGPCCGATLKSLGSGCGVPSIYFLFTVWKKLNKRKEKKKSKKAKI